MEDNAQKIETKNSKSKRKNAAKFASVRIRADLKKPHLRLRLGPMTKNVDV